MTERMTILQNQICPSIVHNIEQKPLKKQGSPLQPTSTLSPLPSNPKVHDDPDLAITCHTKGRAGKICVVLEDQWLDRYSRKA